MEKILNDFKWVIYSDDNIENKIYLNKNELLYRFSLIDFDNIYIDSNLLAKLDEKLLSCKEFNSNYNNSVYSSFFDYANKLNIPFIYNGYHLKNLLLNIAYNFSKCSVPFDMVFKLEKWLDVNKEENIKSYNIHVNQRNTCFNLIEFNNFYNSLKELFDELKNDFNYYILFRMFSHYCQIYLNPKDVSFLLKNIENLKLAKNQNVDVFLSLNFYTIKLFVNQVLFIINDLISSCNHSFKNKIGNFVSSFNSLNIYCIDEQTSEYKALHRNDFIKHKNNEYILLWEQEIKNNPQIDEQVIEPYYNVENNLKHEEDIKDSVNQNTHYDNELNIYSNDLSDNLQFEDYQNEFNNNPQYYDYSDESNKNPQYYDLNDEIVDINDDRLYEIELNEFNQRNIDNNVDNYYQVDNQYDYQQYDYQNYDGLTETVNNQDCFCENKKENNLDKGWNKGKIKKINLMKFIKNKRK